MEVWGGNQAFNGSVTMPGLDAWVFSKPFRDATGGGDVYYVSSCATGRITRLLVADVSGHGAGVAEIAESLRRLMRRHVNYLSQSQFMRVLNRQFGQLASGGSFATALVMTFFSPTQALSLGNAGHPAPIAWHARSGQWGLLRHAAGEHPSNTPLGILDRADYDQIEVRLEEGDLVLCYTDSLIEARGRNGQMLGENGLLEVVRTLDPSRPGELIPSLLEAVQAQAGGHIVDDDVCVLLLRANGRDRRPPLLQYAAAPLRLLRAIVARLLGRPGPVPWPQLTLAGTTQPRLDSLKRLWQEEPSP